MIFRIDKKEKVVLDADAVKLCPVLKKLEQKKLLFVILAYDYTSPFHRFPEAERIRKAKVLVWETTDVDTDKDSFLKECIDEYKSLQYDVKRETMAVYESKIAQMNTELMAEASPRRIKEIDEAIERLAARREKMQREIDMDEEASRVIKGGQQMSMIEKWQENKRKAKQANRNQIETAGHHLL